MADLVLGPILRHVGERDATVWVETDAACEVEVLDATEQTFCVYGPPLRAGLHRRPEAEDPHRVRGEARRRGPLAGAPRSFPASVINSLDPDRPLRILFGSCRVALPHEPPYSLEKDEDDRGRGHDALYILAQEKCLGAEDGHSGRTS